MLDVDEDEDDDDVDQYIYGVNNKGQDDTDEVSSQESRDKVSSVLIWKSIKNQSRNQRGPWYIYTYTYILTIL